MQKLGQQAIYSDYQKWRDTFLYQKLQLAIVIWSFFHAAIELNSLIPEFLGKYYKRGIVSALIFFVNSSRDLLIQELIFIGCLILLRRVYHNLILNAIKVNQPGLQITIDAWVVEDNLHCIVADNGVGMSQQQATKLFELYARGQNLPQSVGLGLGLYICQQIIRAHGGEIGVNSSSGEGATFWFTLPLSK